MQLIGIDCAVNPRDVGVALAEMDDGVAVREVLAGIPNPWGKVADWVLDSGSSDTLLALDAPLGWPAPLADALGRHSAGTPLSEDAHALFRRTTDMMVRDMIDKQPLDVGADRIARTAHAALKGLEQLRTSTGLPLPLAWCADEIGGAHVIEVYPAATLKAHGLTAQGYKHKKKADHRRARDEILSMLPGFRVPADCRSTALANADALDSLVCILAAADFVRGAARPPWNADVARREGWIWCRDPSTGGGGHSRDGGFPHSGHGRLGAG